MRLDLGGGTKNTVAPGHVNIDLTKDADINHNLELGLPLHELAMRAGISHGTVDEVNEIMHKIDRGELPFIEGIRCHQVIEHIRNIIPLMNDCYKILNPGAIFEISTPLAGTTQFWQDPTHVKGYVPESFKYFQENSDLPDAQEEYGITCRFKIIDIWFENKWNMQVRLTK